MGDGIHHLCPVPEAGQPNSEIGVLGDVMGIPATDLFQSLAAKEQRCATKRNGKVIGITRVTDDDELLMMTSRGKIQRIAAREIGVVGRNTQGVRIMSLDEGDTLAAVVRVPPEEGEDEGGEPPAAEAPTEG